MTERILFKTTGGPHDAVRQAPLDKMGGWPLPDQLSCPCHPDGVYVKVAESQISPQPEESFVMRGATYKWRGHADTGTSEET